VFRAFGCTVQTANIFIYTTATHVRVPVTAIVVKTAPTVGSRVSLLDIRELRFGGNRFLRTRARPTFVVVDTGGHCP